MFIERNKVFYKICTLIRSLPELSPVLEKSKMVRHSWRQHYKTHPQNIFRRYKCMLIATTKILITCFKIYKRVY